MGDDVDNDGVNNGKGKMSDGKWSSPTGFAAVAVAACCNSRSARSREEEEEEVVPSKESPFFNPSFLALR